jgi:hypothetical protein
MENQKLTQEELGTIRELQEKNRAVVLEFGEIEIITLNVAKRKENAVKFLDELRTQEQEFGKALSEKYGDGSVDLESGEFIPAPKEETPAAE